MIRRRPNPAVSGIGEESLVASLYGDCDFRYPALAEVADVASRVDAAERRTLGLAVH